MRIGFLISSFIENVVGRGGEKDLLLLLKGITRSTPNSPKPTGEKRIHTDKQIETHRTNTPMHSSSSSPFTAKMFTYVLCIWQFLPQQGFTLKIVKRSTN